MESIEVRQLLDDTSSDYVFEVTLQPSGNHYKVRLSKDYFKKLTDGRVDEAELVKMSFSFLLEHESPDAILKEFDLPAIGNYFPAYEQTIRSRCQLLP